MTKHYCFETQSLRFHSVLFKYSVFNTDITAKTETYSHGYTTPQEKKTDNKNNKNNKNNDNGNIKPINVFVILCVKFIIDSQNKSTEWNI